MQPIAFSCRLHDLHYSIDLVGASLLQSAAPSVRRFTLVHAARLAHCNFGHQVCEASLIQSSPHCCLLVCRQVGSVVFLPRLRMPISHLCGSLVTPSSRGLADAGTLAPGSIRCPELFAVIRLSVAIVVVDLSCCFCFAIYLLL